ncbi:hypothetical protein KAZ66_00615 [Candidatus Woesebacteria bacterium]|nr:hypothetical protein [Candidatus Woesebacteria bacterium]
MGQIYDDDIILCYIDFSQSANYKLFNRGVIHQKLCRDAEIYFKKYGLNFEMIPLGGMGGGGWESIFQQGFMLAWEHRDIIEMVIAFVKTSRNIINYFSSKVINHTDVKDIPKIVIELSLRTEETYTNGDLLSMNPYFQQKLVNLKLISDNLCNFLKKKYEIFNFDQVFSLYIHSREFHVTFNFPFEKQTKFNTFRLIRLFKNFQIRDKFYSVYNFINWFLISRDDGGKSIEEGSSRRSPMKKYYLFISTKILSDYWYGLKLFRYR